MNFEIISGKFEVYGRAGKEKKINLGDKTRGRGVSKLISAAARTRLSRVRPQHRQAKRGRSATGS
jgi:hypothetical protein